MSISNPIGYYPGARTTDPITSHEAAESSVELRGKIAEAILQKALEAGHSGITINEATAALPQFKAVSVSPIFKPLVKAEKLIRRTIARTEPSERWLHGKDVYETRVDPATNKKCIVHYHPSALKNPAGSVTQAPDTESEVTLARRKPPLSTAAAAKAHVPGTERRQRERRKGDRRKRAARLG